MWRFAIDIVKPIAIRENLVLDSEREPVIALVGPNGAGKSTLLRALAGFLGPHQGDLGGMPWERPVTWVSQQPTLFPHRTVRQQVDWALHGRLLSNPALMRWVDILDAAKFLDRRPSALSGGQQQRAMILRALAAQPLVLALDESLSQIDPASRESITSYLREWAKEVPNRLLILATHQFSDVAHLADRVWVMAGGKLLRDGTPVEVVQDPGSWEVAALVGYVARLRWNGVDYALKADSVGWEAPGITVFGIIEQTRAEGSLVRLNTETGRTHFVVPEPRDGSCAGDSVNVYVRGIALGAKEAARSYESSTF